MKSVKRVTNGYSSADPEIQFVIEMDFTDSDPLAVTFSFCSERDPEKVVWEFGRELLIGSLDKSVGSGDVVITPSGDSLSILLRSPNGSIIIETTLSDVREFVNDMEKILPFGQEAETVERQLAAFLADPMGDNNDVKEED